MPDPNSVARTPRRMRLAAALVALSLTLSGCGVTFNDNTLKWTIGHDWVIIHNYFHLQRKPTWQLSIIYTGVCSGTPNQRAACTRDFIDEEVDMSGLPGALSKWTIVTALDDGRTAFRDQMEFIAPRANSDPKWCLTMDAWESIGDHYTWSRRNLDSSDCNEGEFLDP